MGVCISRSPPFAWPPALAPNLYLLALVPNLCLPALSSNLYLPALDSNLHLPTLAYNFITSPGPEFAYTSLVSSICICIYGHGLRFLLPIRGLNFHLPYYYQQGPGSQFAFTGPGPQFVFTLACNIITVPGPEFAFTSLLVAVAVVVVIVVVVISLEQIKPVFACRFQ